MNWVRNLFRGKSQHELTPTLSEHCSSTGDYRFKRPTAWVRVDPSMDVGCPVILYAESPTPSFKANQNGRTIPIFSPAITLIEYPRGITAGQGLSQVFSLFQGVFPTMYAGFTLKSHHVVTLASGQQAMELRFDFTCGTTAMTAHAVMLPTEQKVLWLDGSARSVDFPKYEDTIAEVVASLGK